MWRSLLMRAFLLLQFHRAFSVSDASERLKSRIHGDMGRDDKPKPERERVEDYHRLFGAWPQPEMLARETPGYTTAMGLREKRVMDESDMSKRWNKFMDIVQARAVANFTSTQWHVRRIPDTVYAKLVKQLRDGMANAPGEGGDKGSVDLGVVYVGEPGEVRTHASKYIEQERLNYEILDELTPLHEEWVGVPLEPTAAYGIRIYLENSTMVDHLDVLESHVVSSVLHIDHDLDEPFPFEIEDWTGSYAKVNLEAGDMIFYESAKCYHRRSTPMKGRFHANIFLHYRPKGWPMTRAGTVTPAVPPYWTESSPAVKAKEQRQEQLQVEFSLSREAPADARARIFWVNPGSKEEVQIGELKYGQSTTVPTWMDEILKVYRVESDGSTGALLDGWSIGGRGGQLEVPWRTSQHEASEL